MQVPIPLYCLAQFVLHTWGLHGLPGYKITDWGCEHPADTFTVIPVNQQQIVTCPKILQFLD
jgi:hypothetical protein